MDVEVASPALDDCASLVVTFPDGSHVPDCSNSPVELLFLVQFTSSQPVSYTGHLVFSNKNTGIKYVKMTLSFFLLILVVDDSSAPLLWAYGLW